MLTKRGAPARGAAFVAAPVSPVLTALIEAAWYALVSHIDLWQVPDTIFDPDIAFRASAHVAASGVAFLGVALAHTSPAPSRFGGYRWSAGESR